MDTKIAAAFAGGLLLASGVTYFAMKRPEPAAAVQAQAPAAPAAAPVETSKAESPSAAPAAVTAAPVDKPSPARARRSHEPEPVRPAPAAAPIPAAPAPQPAPPERLPEVARTPEPPPAPREPARVEPPPPPPPHVATIPAGTMLSVRLGETLSTERTRTGDTFMATLEQPLVADGFVIAERGSRAQGRVVEVDRAGKVRGLAQLGIELTQITTADGQKIRVNTAAFQKQAASTKKKDAAKVGIGAALGAAIGAIAGGGKGAGIGAGVGGAAGAGDVLLTRGDAAEIPVETRLTFRLSEPVTVTERLR